MQVLKENIAKATQQLTIGSCGGVAPTRIQVVQFTEYCHVMLSIVIFPFCYNISVSYTHLTLPTNREV